METAEERTLVYYETPGVIMSNAAPPKPAPSIAIRAPNSIGWRPQTCLGVETTRSPHNTPSNKFEGATRKLSRTLNNHMRNGEFIFVRKRKMNSANTDFLGELGRAAMQTNRRLASGIADNFNLAQPGLLARARSQRLEHRLLSRKTRSQMLILPGARKTIIRFRSSKYLIKKTFPVALHTRADTGNINNINSRAKNHTRIVHYQLGSYRHNTYQSHRFSHIHKR